MALSSQPTDVVPVTVYVVVAVGETFIDVPDKLPGIQVYVTPAPAPVPVNDIVWPGQLLKLAPADIVGVVLTVTVTETLVLVVLHSTPFL